MKKTHLLALLPLLLAGCNAKNTPYDKTIVIGASPTPHTDILKVAQPFVEAAGYKLKIKVFDDYVTPNLALESGELDANYFQHTPYLDDFNLNNGTHLEAAFKVHFEPMGIYSVKHTEIKSGIQYTYAIPNDNSNGKRATDLLNSLGVECSYKMAVASSLPALLQDVDFAVINGNYALSSGITDKCLETESSESEMAQTNANIVAVKADYIECEFVEVLKTALLSDEVKEYINSTYNGAVKAVF